jgi:hypothetical protein
MADKTVDGYIAALEPWQAEIATAVRRLVREAAPETTEAIKWSQPVFESNGPVCYVKAFKNHVNFGFWRGAELDDPEGLLESTGSQMAHVKLQSAGDLRPKPLRELVRQAVRLNALHGNPATVRRRKG